MPCTRRSWPKSWRAEGLILSVMLASSILDRKPYGPGANRGASSYRRYSAPDFSGREISNPRQGASRSEGEEPSGRRAEPERNGVAERFIRTLEDECIHLHDF